MKIFGEVYPYSKINDYVAKIIFDYFDNQELLFISRVNKDWNNLAKGILHQRNVGTIIPTHDEDISQLLPYLGRIFAPNPAISYTIKNLDQGFSPRAQKYLVTINNNEYVIRFYNQEKEFNSFTEMYLMSVFSINDISPAIHFVDYKNGLVVMDYIHNIPKWHNKIDDSIIEELAKSISIIHQGPILARNPYVQKNSLLLDRSQKIEKVLEQHTNKFPLIRYIHDKIIEYNQIIYEVRCCHYDLNPNNILFDGTKLLFIDWECAGKGDPFLDLATVAVGLRFSTTQDLRFLSHYLGKTPTNKEKSKYFLMKELAFLKLASSFFANIENFNTLTDVDISMYPAFLDYKPSDRTIDIRNDEGKFYVSVMLAKEALKSITTFKHYDAFNLLTDNNRHTMMHDYILAQIFTYLEDKDLHKIQLVSKTWKNLALGELFSRYHQYEPPQISESIPKQLGHQIIKSLIHFCKPNYDLVYSVEPLGGGLSPWASTFLLNLNGKKYVLRMLDDSLSGANIREFWITKLFSSINVAPFVEFVDTKNNLIIQQYVDNNPLWVKDIDVQRIIDLSRLLKELHTVKLPSASIKLNSNIKFDQFYYKVDHIVSNHEDFRFFKAIMKNYNILQEAVLDITMKNPALCTLCHYDLNPWNLLYSENRFWAIDWELSQVGNKLFDLATIANFLRLPKESENFLLVSYFGKVSTEVLAAYYITKQFVYLRYSICSLGINDKIDFIISDQIIEELPPFQIWDPRKLQVQKSTNEGRFKIAVMFGKEAMQNIASPEFQDALIILNINQKTTIKHYDITSLQPTSEHNTQEEEIEKDKLERYIFIGGKTIPCLFVETTNIDSDYKEVLIGENSFSYGTIGYFGID